jgi:murein DD-endopeptidase MepM/ murein hydrolase activator NlpD
MLKTRLAAVAAGAAAAAALVLLLFGAASAAAKDLESKLDAKEATLSKVRRHRGVLTSTISHHRVRIERLTREVAALRNREAAVRARLRVKQRELDVAQGELDVAKRHLAVVRARLKRALTALRERLVAMYESGSPDILTAIVDAGGYEDLVARTEYLNRIHGLDEAVVGRVRELRDQVKRTVSRLRAAKDRIEAARDAIAAEERALADARTALQRRQSALVATRRSREAVLEKVEAAEQKLDGDVASIQAELAARLAGTGSAPLPAGPIRGGSGSGLIWPVDGPVVSGFGSRFGGGEFHEGIDIAVPSGTPIRAAAAGTVLFTESGAGSGGYGNFTCVDHGGGLSTCYAHQQSFAVGAGRRVSQGQIVGYSDCTGHCFGPHVHFEVRIDGAPTDPMGYL